MIEVRQKLKPFSHLPGVHCLIPKTAFAVEAFPALIRVWDIEKKKVVLERPLAIEGPLYQFTLTQDLERGAVTISSEKYRFHILPSLEIIQNSQPPFTLEKAERLYLGSNKKLEWESIKKRRDFREIFPIWFALGSFLDLPAFSHEKKGVFSLLDDVQRVISKKRPEHIIDAFEKLFLAGFKHLMVPRLFDDEFQGIVSEAATGNPLYLLSEGARLIRSLFFETHKKELLFLPNLPPEFFSGRFLNLKLPPYGDLDIEWTKKMIRQVVFRPTQNASLVFHFPSSIRSFRVRHSRKEKGLFYSNREELEIKSDRIYLLDQFKK